MFRASSEMAVAIRVASTAEKPSSAASVRPSRRARTMSASRSIGICFSPFKRRSSGAAALLGFLSKVGKSLLQIEPGDDALQGESQLNHRERDLGLNSHDHGLGAAQADHVGDLTDGQGG